MVLVINIDSPSGFGMHTLFSVNLLVKIHTRKKSLDPPFLAKVNQHPYWYFHLLERGFLVAILRPKNVRIGLREPDLI
jgi:hypothetical protein